MNYQEKNFKNIAQGDLNLESEEGINYTYLYITGGIVLLLIAAGIFILKRKQASE